jgi:hypothetical protein
MAAVLGHHDWKLTRDTDGHRTYDIDWLCKVDFRADGPATALATPGLPAIGSTWAVGNDIDSYAYCWPNWRVRPVLATEKGYFWMVSQQFSTKPFKRCQDTSIENPIDEPPKIRGSYVKTTREATNNYDGTPILSSSHEYLKGPDVEFDKHNPSIVIEFNTLILPLADIDAMINTVNDAPLWGFEARCVKLDNCSWQRQVYGVCNFYYTATLEFLTDVETFDRDVRDRGKRTLKGWMPGSQFKIPLEPDDPDPDVPGKLMWQNPLSFEVYKDENGENTEAILDGKGRPVDDLDNAGEVHIEYYPESNFLTLGIPLVLI